MEWDLGLRGVAVLAAMSIAFGAFAQLVLWRAGIGWPMVIASALYFLAGIFVSEVWFGWATEEDLQPNIDGLSFDEVLLIATFPGAAVVAAFWFWARRHRHGLAHAETVSPNG